MLPKKETSSPKKKTLNSYLKYSGLAFQMAISIVLAAYAGKYADQKLQFEVPWLTITLCLLAIFGNLYLVFKSVTSD